MLSHANAFTFLDWCDETLGPWRDDDRFSSHAPFHFDLSVFDLFVSCRNAATLVLIGEALGKEPGAARRLPGRAADQRLVLGPVDPGPPDPARRPRPAGLPSRRGWSCSPARSSRSARCGRLRELWPEARLWNLYGPTETNVCTAYPIPATIPDDRTAPYPDRHGLPAAPGPGGRRGGPRRARRARSASW